MVVKRYFLELNIIWKVCYYFQFVGREYYPSPRQQVHCCIMYGFHVQCCISLVYQLVLYQCNVNNFHVVVSYIKLMQNN